MRMPWLRFLNLIYAWCVERIGPEKREEWEYQMKMPLPGQEKRATPAQIEDEGESFMQMMALQGSM